MSNSEIYIEKIIYNWCIRDDNYGLTLPNIVGAIRLKSNDVHYSIKDFFRDILKVNLDVKISLCPDLKEYVFGTFKREDAPKRFYSEVNLIFYSKNELNIKSYEELIISFENKYSEKIEAGLYSKNYYSKKWSGLTTEDNDFLNTIE
jgi:hypothetical protein